MKLITSYNEIKPYIELGLVNEQVHPEEPNLRIFNYTQKCQFSGEWNDITRQCRGLIMNVATGEIIARPFAKFFNYQEHINKNWPIPSETPVVTEKLDGSLGILYWLNGKPYIATRGSFASEQAIWATNWIRDNMPISWLRDQKTITYLFEIIYPQNRIVVNYNFSGLVLLTAISNETGKDTFPGFDTLIDQVRRIPLTDIDALSALDEPNSEGFVVFYPNANIRMKIKFPEYVRLHKLITGVNEITIWEYLKEGKSLNELIDKVPDEYYQWLASISNRLNNSYNEIHSWAETEFNKLVYLKDRKEFALEAQKTKHPGLLFSLLDNKPLKDQIWRLIRPKGQSNFKVDIDS